MLVDQLDFDPLTIEANLAHAVKDSNVRSYNRTLSEKTVRAGAAVGELPC